MDDAARQLAGSGLRSPCLSSSRTRSNAASEPRRRWVVGGIAIETRRRAARITGGERRTRWNRAGRISAASEAFRAAPDGSGRAGKAKVAGTGVDDGRRRCRVRAKPVRAARAMSARPHWQPRGRGPGRRRVRRNRGRHNGDGLDGRGFGSRATVTALLAGRAGCGHTTTSPASGRASSGPKSFTKAPPRTLLPTAPSETTPSAPVTPPASDHRHRRCCRR